MPFLRQKSSEFGIILSATEHAVIICVLKNTWGQELSVDGAGKPSCGAKKGVRFFNI